jgi:hypothetical protein
VINNIAFLYVAVAFLGLNSRIHLLCLSLAFAATKRESDCRMVHAALSVVVMCWDLQMQKDTTEEKHIRSVCECCHPECEKATSLERIMVMTPKTQNSCLFISDFLL